MSSTKTEPGYAEADELKRLVMARIGVTDPKMLECPREKSFMTPCIARDGQLAVAYAKNYPGDRDQTPICVGCERLVLPLLARERAR